MKRLTSIARQFLGWDEGTPPRKYNVAPRIGTQLVRRRLWRKLRRADSLRMVKLKLVQEG